MRNTTCVVDHITNKIQDTIGAEKLSTGEIIEVISQLKLWAESALNQLMEEK